MMNGQNHRFNQPTPTVTNSSSSVNVENKKTKRQGDFGYSCHPRKKLARNNEIFSSYSSSIFLIIPGQKRAYPSDHKDESPDRKHCKSCTCCGFTVILNNDRNNSNKSDKTTEIDMSDDLVTVAASRIFNRSGKTQVFKKVCMKTILDEVFDDADPIPYTSIEKIEEKRKKAQKQVISIEQHNINKSENKPTASGMVFSNNTTNPMFQFNNTGSKLGDKPSETPSSSFPFTSNKTTPAFRASAPQDLRDKPAFQFNTQKTEEPKTQFSTPSFGTPNTSAPFKFGGNDKPASFGTPFPSTNQPLQFTNNTEKTAEPFKFGSSVQTSNAFQFRANKTDNGPVKFGQATSTFATSGFSGFGNSAPQQTTTFGTVQPPQPFPFGNITSPTAAPTFGSVASPPSNTFGTNQIFQFGSTNNAPTSSSTFAFGSNSQPIKPDGAFSFNAASTTASPFQFGQDPSPLSTPQFGGTQPNQGSFGFGSPPMTFQMTATVMPGSSQPLFSMGTAPAGERRKAKAVRRRQ